MRVLEPHHFNQPKKPGKRRLRKQRFTRLMAVMLVAASLSYIFVGQPVEAPSQPQASTTSISDPVGASTGSQKQLRQFTAEAFRQAYSSYLYPNTLPIESPPSITGNDAADQRIRQLAEARGYKLTAVPVASIVKTDEVGLEGDDLVQPNALLAWQQLKTAAAAEDIPLKLNSAYRSIDYQRTLFMRRLQAAGVNADRVLEGYADDEIDAVLARAAIPGYSRHHTGYAIDLSCNGVGLEAFAGTSCYKWLSQNNFENAKLHGWVPSYPEGVGSQGPEPESWEYVWIGIGRTYQ